MQPQPGQAGHHVRGPPVVQQPVVAPAEEAVPNAEGEFTFHQAAELLKGSTASAAAGYFSLLSAVVILIVNLHLIGGNGAGSAGGPESDDLRDAKTLYVACAGTFAAAQVISLAKTTRDRFVASLHDQPGAPQGIDALKGTTESYLITVVAFLASMVFCIHAISGLVDTTTDETISLILSLFFLICSTAWVCKSTRDRADVKNKLWGTDEQLTPLILRLARGTGSNVILNVTALVSSIVLTLVCIWKSDSSEFDSTLKLLLTMGEVFQTIAAFWLSKIVRDAAIPERVTTTDWLLAGGGAVAAVGFTYVGLLTKWDKIGDALGVTLLTGLVFSLFSTMFFAKLVRDHKELQKRGWDVSLMATICSGKEFEKGRP